MHANTPISNLPSVVFVSFFSGIGLNDKMVSAFNPEL